MVDDELNRQIGNMRAGLETVEAQVARGRFSPDGLVELKSAIDEIRLRMWSIMSAASSTDYDTFSQRFRLRRASEILSGIVEDLRSGKLKRSHEELKNLAAAASLVIAESQPK
jgi:hypothetical protein